ncbi:hypothetical protein PLEOSDRAFT_164078 [Pleurotus ostreatus PC15]|uniref:Uncharacterized protein n=1 Tax=Pleurotus ostreatus (strain PC15) TaxID=1137138 RepID=A0A067PDL3_PLEO1|nr:hypothetical protein PLEOSDRAFT_164078 [Pleurotus ostreatus PC15]
MAVYLRRAWTYIATILAGNVLARTEGVGGVGSEPRLQFTDSAQYGKALINDNELDQAWSDLIVSLARSPSDLGGKAGERAEDPEIVQTAELIAGSVACPICGKVYKQKGLKKHLNTCSAKEEHRKRDNEFLAREKLRAATEILKRRTGQASSSLSGVAAPESITVPIAVTPSTGSDSRESLSRSHSPPSLPHSPPSLPHSPPSLPHSPPSLPHSPPPLYINTGADSDSNDDGSAPTSPTSPVSRAVLLWFDFSLFLFPYISHDGHVVAYDKLLTTLGPYY